MSLVSNIPFSCEEFEDRVNDLLDMRLSPRDDLAVAAHAECCPPCGQLLDDYVAVDDSMKLLKGDIESILRESQNRPSPKLGRKWRLVAFVSSTAALLLVLLNLTINQPDVPEVAVLDAAKQAALAPTTNTRSHTQGTWSGSPGFPYQFSQALSALASNIDLDSTVIGNPGINFTETGPWEEMSESLGGLESVLQLSSEIPGVRPVRGTMGIAIDYIRRALQQNKTDANPDLGRYLNRSSMLAAV